MQCFVSQCLISKPCNNVNGSINIHSAQSVMYSQFSIMFQKLFQLCALCDYSCYVIIPAASFSDVQLFPRSFLMFPLLIHNIQLSLCDYSSSLFVIIPAFSSCLFPLVTLLVYSATFVVQLFPLYFTRLFLIHAIIPALSCAVFYSCRVQLFPLCFFCVHYSCCM
jgi:hypothetical protein